MCECYIVIDALCVGRRSESAKWSNGKFSLVMLASSSHYLRHGSVADMNYKPGRNRGTRVLRGRSRRVAALAPNALSEILYIT